MNPAPRDPVPVFPLPGFVMFPGVVMPLHVFELRYRTMVRDALSGERMIAMATLLPGWEPDYHGSPPFESLGCVGRIEEIEWLPNDSYDLKLRGLSRVRFVRTVKEFPYRACEVELMPPAPFDADDPLAMMERHALLQQVRTLQERGIEAWLAPPELPPDASLELVVNTLAQCSRLDVRTKLELLALESVFERARLLGERLSAAASGPRRSPPPGGAAEGGRWN